VIYNLHNISLIYILHQTLRFIYNSTPFSTICFLTSLAGTALPHNLVYSEDLLREIEWLLEDAVDEYSPNLATFEAPITLNMRTSVEDLYSLWSDRVEKRRPFQYIVGCSHWRDVVLSVQEGVLIPRPVTEELIEIAQKAIATDGSLARGVWADLGTGSGALAIGLAQLLDPEGHVVAVDLSHVALSIARYNVQRYELQVCVGVLALFFFP
jgi:release factor glutamine methyltransferase